MAVEQASGASLREYEFNQWQEFYSKISGFPPAARADIECAYMGAQRFHRGQARISGERYFSHPRRVALILIEEAGITNPTVIISALLHDTAEDTSMWEPPPGSRLSKFSRIGAIFDLQIELDLEDLTMDIPAGNRENEKEEAEKVYYQTLADASCEALLVKLADRLHNLRTLGAMPPDKQVKKIGDTFILTQICKRAADEYPKETDVLLKLTEKATRSAITQLPRSERRTIYEAHQRAKRFKYDEIGDLDF